MRPPADVEPGHLLGAIFSASPDAIVVIDRAGTILTASPATTALFGYYPQELIGASIATLLPLDRRAAHARHIEQFFAEPRARQMGAGLELFARHRDGSDFAVDVSLAPVEVRGAPYVAAFVRDGRERRRAIDRLQAVNDITQQLLSGSTAREIFPVVAQRARALSGADAVWIVLPNEAGDLEVVSVDGPGTDVLLGFVLSAETSRSAQVMRTGTSEVIDDLAAAANVPAPLASMELGPGVYVPLVAAGRALGALVFGRVHGAPDFQPLDVAFVEVFASAITASVELGNVRAQVERLGIVAEDERIARDLHDTVIQQLFAIGMSLQAGRNAVSGQLGDRIDDAVDGLDLVIKEVRNTIFRLPGRSEAAVGLREDMLRVADRFGEQLGFAARVVFEGPVEISVPDEIAANLLQVFGEALSNVARHAHASAVDVVLTVEQGSLTLLIADDGVGTDPGPTAGSGLRNMAERASTLGGSALLRRREPSGTIIEWKVPI